MVPLSGVVGSNKPAIRHTVALRFAPDIRLHRSPTSMNLKSQSFLSRLLSMHPEDLTGPRAEIWHGLALGGIAVLFVMSVALGHMPGPAPLAVSIRGIAPMLSSVALALLAIERILSLLGWGPLSSRSLRRSLLARHPLLLAALAVILHLTTLTARETLLAVRHPDFPIAYRIAVLGLVCVAALPFWLMLLHPVKLARASKALRQS